MPFEKGWAGGPGRPSKATEEALLDEINLHFPAELIIEKLNLALEIAEKQKSTRAILKCLEFVVSYTVGEPVKRIVHSKDGYQQLAELIQMAGEIAAEQRLIGNSTDVLEPAESD